MSTLLLAVALFAAAPVVSEAQEPSKCVEYQRSLNAFILDGKKPMLVLVSASWCPACQQMKKTIEEAKAAGLLKNVEYAYVDSDAYPALAKKLLDGRSIPQLICYRATNVVHSSRLKGAHCQADILKLITGGYEH